SRRRVAAAPTTKACDDPGIPSEGALWPTRDQLCGFRAVYSCERTIGATNTHFIPNGPSRSSVPARSRGARRREGSAVAVFRSSASRFTHERVLPGRTSLPLSCEIYRRVSSLGTKMLFKVPQNPRFLFAGLLPA